MTIQTKTKSSELMSRLVALHESNEINEFILKSIENEAIRLKKTDAHSAYMIFGIIAAMEGDSQRCHREFSRSIALNDDEFVQLNYVTSLLRLGQITLAYSKLLPLLSQSKGDVALYRLAATLSTLVGHPEKTIEFSEILQKFQAENDQDTHDVIKNARNILSLNLPEHYFETIMSVAGKVCAEVKAQIKGMQYIYDLPEGGGILWLQTNKESEQVVDMNIRYCDILAENELDPLASKVVTVLFRAAV